MTPELARVLFPQRLHWHVQRGIKFFFSVLAEYQAPHTVFWDTYASTFKEVLNSHRNA